jgi:transcriptional regulator with XRE-family HTH domain
MYSKRDTDDFLVNLGKKFKNQRELKQLTREKCAVECEMSRSYLYKLEAGEANPSIRELFKLANGLNCKISDIIP